MTDMVVSVVLKADGTGLVGQTRLSAEAVDGLTRAMKLGSVAGKELSAATAGTASAAREAATAEKQGAAATEEAARKKRDLANASSAATKSLGAQRAGYQQISYQLQDVVVQAQMGTSAFVILAQQGGQLAQGIALLGQSANGTKGKFASFASFLGGPWGAALSLAITLAGALGTALLKSGEAAEAAKLGSDGLSDAQSVLGQMFDLSNGKIKRQNELLLLNAQIVAMNLRAEAQIEHNSSLKTFSNSSNLSWWSTFKKAAIQSPNGLGLDAKTSQDLTGAKPSAVQSLEAERQAALKWKLPESRAKALRAVLRKSNNVDFSGLAITREEYQKALRDAVSADAKDAIADELEKTLDTGELSGVFLQPHKPLKPKKPKVDHEAERLASFGDRSAEAVARLDDEYNTAPRDIDRARQATAQLDKIIGDINAKMATSKKLTAEQREKFEAIKKSAADLKPLIRESLQRPITDMLKQQQQQIDLGAAQLTGRQSEVEALQLTQQLMTRLGAETKEQLATELAKRGITGDQVNTLYDNLAVMREQSRELEKQQVRQQAYLNALGDAEAIIRRTLADMPVRGVKALGDMFKQMVSASNNLFADVVTEKFFGNIFRELRDQVTGADKVSKAGKEMAKAVDKASASLGDFTTAVQKATDKLSGTAAGDTAPASGDDGPPLIVENSLKSSFREAYEGVFQKFKKEISGALERVFGKVFGDDGTFAKSLPKALGEGMANAQIGAAVGKGVTDILGVKGSSTGGAIGGAIGGALMGPLGTVVGGVLGSVVGGVLKKSRSAAATVTGGTTDDISVGGKDKKNYSVATDLGESVVSGLQQIADAFGGSVGSFYTTIGVRHGDYRVNTNGSSLKTAKGAVEFNDDATGAVAYALADAVADGAIQGISEKVAEALKSKSDISEAIAEAQKVQSLELLLGGVTAEIEQQMRTFEAQAKERLRIAEDYGFDVVAIEKKNAEERAALVDQILADSVGDLQSMLDDIKYGDLFEGTAADQRQALLAEIASAQDKALAGEDGAASTLADLQRRLLELSKDAFGTAGTEYAADRSSVMNSAQAVIDAENARIKAAENATAETNAKLAEANDLASQGNELAKETNGLLGSIVSGLAGAGAAGSVARIY